MAKNIRHDIDPALVKAQIETRIASMRSKCAANKIIAKDLDAAFWEDVANGNHKKWRFQPQDPESVEKTWAEFIKTEKPITAKYAL